MDASSNPYTAHQHDEAGPFGIPELVHPRIEAQSCALSGRRLNLVIPWISDKIRSFGGPATALRLFERLAPEFDHARIVVTRETESEVNLRAWPDFVIDGGGVANRSIAFVADRASALSLAATDLFVATHWSTVVYVRRVIARQTEIYPKVGRRFVYLIQEYEAVDYPESALREYVLSTYRDRASTIAVFNSRPVADYFRARAFSFYEQYTFESMLHPQLSEARIKMGDRIKERIILVYGRSTVKNGFDLIVEALRMWVSSYARSSEWTLISAGFTHADVHLGQTMVLRSQGTLALGDYALLLSRCWAGLSFCFSASTSHFTRDVAEFGAWSITNQFEHRERLDLPANVICTDPTPESVSESLKWCCEQYQPNRTAVLANLSSVFTTRRDEFPFANALVKSLQDT